MERIIDKAPDVIIVSSMKGEGRFAEIREKWMRWKVLPAVRHDRIYLVENDGIFRPSPRILDGLEELTNVIHPEIAGKIKRPL
jgi:iron complex transport system substrate-binding protein